MWGGGGEEGEVGRRGERCDPHGAKRGSAGRE